MDISPPAYRHNDHIYLCKLYMMYLRAAIKYISKVEMNEGACDCCVHGGRAVQSAMRVDAVISMFVSRGLFFFIFFF